MSNTKKTIKDFEDDFKSYIIEYCKNYNHGYYDAKDIDWFEKIADEEYESLLDQNSIDDLDFECGAEEAKECISYWFYGNC